jgi:hypothetical protein
VVQQGPLNETFLYRFLTDWLHRPWDLRKTKIRFAANVFPDDLLTCGGTVTRKYYENGEPRVDCQIWQQNQKSERILVGEATFTLPERDKAETKGEMGKRGNVRSKFLFSPFPCLSFSPFRVIPIFFLWTPRRNASARCCLDNVVASPHKK